MVFSIAWHFLRNRALAEELAQEVFLQLHRDWHSIQSPRLLICWLRKSSARRAMDVARRRRRRGEIIVEETGEPTVLEQLHDSFLSSYLERMVASLPEKQRMAIVLRYQEDMELHEIAQIMDTRVRLVETYLSNGLERLRSKTASSFRKRLDPTV